MRIVVTGACGLLGAHLAAQLEGRHTVTGVDRHPWWGDRSLALREGDLEEDSFLQSVMKEAQPEAVIHCAAMTDVDACQKDPERALRLNAGTTGRLLRASPKGALFVYISTDAVFAGDRSFTPEEHPACPKTVYGQSKLRGEQEVREGTKNHLILRTNFYGWSSGRKKTFAEWLVRALETGEPIFLYEDFFFTPIYVIDLTHRIALLLEGAARGTVHVAGRERLSKADFGRQLAGLAGFSLANVTAGSLDQRPLPAERPKDLSLSTEKFKAWTGLELPDARSGIRRFLADRGKLLSARLLEFQTQ